MKKSKRNKIINLSLIGLALGLILTTANPAITQTGNQSDSTMPNLMEIQSDVTMPNPVNQSDVTGLESEETLAEPPEEDIDSVEESALEGEEVERSQSNPDTEKSDLEGESVERSRESTDSGEEPTFEGESVERSQYDLSFQLANFGEAIQQFEELQAVEFANRLGINLYGTIPTNDEIARTLCNLFQITGKKAALIYVSSQKDQLEVLPVFPTVPIASGATRTQCASRTSDRPTRKTIPEADRETVKEIIQNFRRELTDRTKRRFTKYLEYAQQLYKWIVAPLTAELETNKIDILIFTMDTGLRSIPIAALHDGKQFLIEKYGVGLVPSFGLTDTRYVDIRKMPILAMGASQFKDEEPLPSVPLELKNILAEVGSGETFLNEQFTLENFKSINKRQRFGIIHLATHGEFQPGNLSNSYIQFWDTKLSVDKLDEIAQELGWNAADAPPVELLVLSACKTAVGDEQAELGFAGLAVQTGVKTALASLWYVSDAGSLGLMSEFYRQLNGTPIKSEALRQAQLGMLRGQVRIENSQLRLSDGSVVPLSPEVVKAKNVNLSHPYFWAGYTLIGNWN